MTFFGKTTMGGTAWQRHLVWLVCILGLWLPESLTADQFGDFTYTDAGTYIVITDYPQTATGAVVIPSSIDGKPVTTIGDNSFDYCAQITSIEVPNTVTTIGASAFDHCSKLTSIALPNSVTSIGPLAFSYCIGLTSISIPTGLATIEASTFNSCTALTSVDLSNTVTSIGKWAFSRCSKLVWVDIPASVTLVDFEAFAFCGALEGAFFLGDAPTLENRAFYDPGDGFALYYLEGSSGFTSPIWSGYPSIMASGRAGLFVYQAIGDTIKIVGYAGHALTTPLEVPDQLLGKPVTIDLPAGITSVGSYAFVHCISLLEITIPQGITSIGEYTFAHCSSLTRFDIPSGVTSIGNNAFDYCGSLTDITLPAGITSISASAFAGCASLTSIIIPSGVLDIGPRAFSDCTSLVSVDIPATVTTVGDYSFSSCRKQKNLFFHGDAIGLPVSMFAWTDEDFTIYYSAGSAGFTSPTWNGYTTTMIDEAECPAASWLLLNDFGYDASLEQDLNGDGVSLLMAYALGLNPTENLAGDLPVPRIENNKLTLPYYAGNEGVSYLVEASTDLSHWESAGVVVTGPDADGVQEASIALDGPCRFLRLVVTQ